MSTIKEKTQVIMLPTKDLTNISKSNQLGLAYMKEPCTIHTEHISNQHLYILSDEKIKVGDWILTPNNEIKKFGQIGTYLSKDKKIIATTDTSLKFREYTEEEKDKAHNNKLPNIWLYKIPQDFIEYYVKEYNKGNIITEVNVEYTYNAYEKLHCNTYKKVLKVSKDNTISILPVKNSWTKEEHSQNIIYAIAEFAAEKGLTSTSNEMKGVNEWAKTWIKENL